MNKLRPLSFFFIFSLYDEILTICAFDQSMKLTEITS